MSALPTPEHNSGDLMTPATDPREFLDYLAQNVTPDMLISDRPGQARLDKVLEGHFWHVNDPYDTTVGSAPNHALPNTNPVIALMPAPGRLDVVGVAFVHRPFQLREAADTKHFYFFNAGHPAEALPKYLRSQDVVSSGRTDIFGNDIPFNKPLERVPVTGGLCELYDYNEDRWTTDSGRQYVPLRQKYSRLGRMLHLVIGSKSKPLEKPHDPSRAIGQ